MVGGESRRGECRRMKGEIESARGERERRERRERQERNFTSLSKTRVPLSLIHTHTAPPPFPLLPIELTNTVALTPHFNRERERERDLSFFSLVTPPPSFFPLPTQ
jgi:hypothetical protein